MPNCDFYAESEDLTHVLDFVFSLADCRVFESYSPYEQELVEFRSSAEVAARYALGICTGTAPSVLLSLWPVRASSSAVHQRRIALVPAKCQGATFRWTIEGWGLITMQLGGSSLVGLVASHTNHNSS